MRRGLVVLAAVALVFGGVACNERNEQEARDAAEQAGEAVERGAEEAGEAAREAADRVEDVANDRQVQIDNNAYEPERREVTVGTEVTWINRDDVEHTVTSEDEVFDSEPLSENEEFSHRFTEAGTFRYFCEIHGEDTMSGTIVVESD